MTTKGAGTGYWDLVSHSRLHHFRCHSQPTSPGCHHTDRWLLSRSWVACTMATGLRKKRHDAMHDTATDHRREYVVHQPSERRARNDLPAVPWTSSGRAPAGRTISGCQNIKLAIASYDGVHCRNGHTSSLTLRHLGTDPPRSTGLYS